MWGPCAVFHTFSIFLQQGCFQCGGSCRTRGWYFLPQSGHWTHSRGKNNLFLRCKSLIYSWMFFPFFSIRHPCQKASRGSRLTNKKEKKKERGQRPKRFLFWVQQQHLVLKKELYHHHQPMMLRQLRAFSLKKRSKYTTYTSTNRPMIIMIYTNI